MTVLNTNCISTFRTLATQPAEKFLLTNNSEPQIRSLFELWRDKCFRGRHSYFPEIEPCTVHREDVDIRNVFLKITIRIFFGSMRGSGATLQKFSEEKLISMDRNLCEAVPLLTTSAYQFGTMLRTTSKPEPFMQKLHFEVRNMHTK